MHPPEKLWLTRDKVEGELSDTIEAWTLVPDRLQFGDGDVMWVAPLDLVDRRPTLLTHWCYADALERFGSDVPCSSIMCTSVSPSAGAC